MIKNLHKIDKQHLKICPLCNSSNYRINEIDALGYQYGINESFNYSRCYECGVVFQNPRVDPEFISVYYDENYYTHKKSTNKIDSKLSKIISKFIKKIKVLKWKLQSHFDYRFPNIQGKLLDYGAGSGHLLNMLHLKGWEDLWGYDTDPQPFLSENNSINRIYDNDLFPLKKELINSFDYIISNHSLEHIANPVEIIEMWYLLLKPGGQLIVATPSADSMNYKYFKNYWYFLTPPYHYIIYTADALENSLKKIGFEISSTTFRSNSQCLWGSLDLMLQKNNVKNNEPFRMFLNNQRLLGVISKPLMLILDFFKKGDNLIVKAKKPIADDES